MSFETRYYGVVAVLVFGWMASSALMIRVSCWLAVDRVVVVVVVVVVVFFFSFFLS